MAMTSIDAFTRIDEPTLGGACPSFAVVPAERQLWRAQQSSILSERLAAMGCACRCTSTWGDSKTLGSTGD